MQGEIQEAIGREASKLIRRHSERTSRDAEFRKHYAKRTGCVSGLPSSKTPQYWTLDKQFDPFYVRSRRIGLAYSIANSIRSGKYLPKPCLRQKIPKLGGGHRTLSVFSVPDSAVSWWLFRKLLDRNLPVLSSFSFAYRADRNAHHAIQHVAQAVRKCPRAYVLEYDFSTFFDSIRHDYLTDVMRRHLKISPRELLLVQKFLKHSYSEDAAAYKNQVFKQVECGVPQGTSISLFLANVACLELDRQLEQTGATFARFADDTVIVCEDYATASAAASIMLGFGANSGAHVNLKKSLGISLVPQSKHSEIKSKESFDFLGHEISRTGIAPSDRTIIRWKRMVSRVINIHLLKHPKAGAFSPNRLSSTGTDWDLVTCINELRNRIYGQISEADLTAALCKSAPLRKTICFLTFYPLVDVPLKLRRIDGWLASTLHRAYVRRRQLLAKIGQMPPAIERPTLIAGTWYKDTQIVNETRLPSFFRAWLYVRKCHNTYGLRHFPNPPYVS